jgi:hypothetical protein
VLIIDGVFAFVAGTLIFVALRRQQSGYLLPVLIYEVYLSILNTYFCRYIFQKITGL